MPLDRISAFGYRVRLYAKPGRAERSLIIGCGVAIIVVAIIGLPLLPLAASLALLLGVICLFAVVGFLVVLRTGAWLEGTTLVIRGGFSRHECDLAATAVRLAADPASGMPLLIVDDAGGAPMRLLLREPGGRAAEPLSPAKLHALASAILAGGRQDAAGQEAAGQLSALADTRPENPPRR